MVLLDEIEKAHPDVFNTLLQVLEDGILTDGQGRRVDFRNTIIIMTSNVGAHLLRQDKAVGFRTEDRESSHERMRDQVMGELRRTFRPEFLNRIDDVIVFNALEREHIRSIVNLMLDELKTKLQQFELSLSVTPAAQDLLSDEGFDPVYGARPLRRAIQRLLEDEISEEMLKGTFTAGDTIFVDVADGKLEFKKEQKQPAG